MKKGGALIGVVIALGIGYFIFKSQVASGPTGGAPPRETIDVVGVKNDLIAIAQAERMYMASHGSYAALDQLQQEGTLAYSPTNRRGYDYTATFEDGTRFKISAVPSDPAKRSWPSLSIDETMQVVQQ